MSLQAQQGASRDTVDGVGVSLGRRKGVTLSEEQASSEEGDSRERLSIVHTDADRGPSPATTTLVSIGSPPPRPRSRGGPDRGGSGPPWTRGGLYHGGPCRPSDIPRQTMEELKTTLREGPHLAFRVQGEARSREPSTPHLKGQNAVQGGGGASDQGHRRVLTTFKPHEGGASIRAPGPGDPRAGQHPSSPFRPDAFPYRSPGGRYPPPGGWDPSDEAGRSQTGRQFTRKYKVLVILPHKVTFMCIKLLSTYILEIQQHRCIFYTTKNVVFGSYSQLMLQKYKLQTLSFFLLFELCH